MDNTLPVASGPSPKVARGTGAAIGPHRGTRRTSQRLDFLRFALGTLMVLGISRMHEIIPVIGAMRPGVLLLGAAAIIAILRPSRLAPRAWMQTLPTRLVVGLLLASLLSIPLGISPGGSAFFFLDRYSKVLAFAFLLLAATRGGADVLTFARAYVVGATLLAWSAIFLFQLEGHGEGFSRLGNMSTWDSNDAGLLLVVAVPLTLLLWRSSRSPARILWLLALALIGMAIARTGSRGAFVTVAILCILLLMTERRVSIATRVLVATLLPLFLWIGSPPGYWQQIGTIFNPKADYNWDSSGGRRALALRGLGYFATHPVAGIGIGNFGRAEGTISSLARDWTPSAAGIKWSAPHNTYIEAAAEMGVSGAALWVTLMATIVFSPIAAVRSFRRRTRHTNAERMDMDDVARYLSLAGLAFALASFFVSFVYHEIAYFLAALNSGLLLQLRHGRPNQRAAPGPSAANGRPRQ